MLDPIKAEWLRLLVRNPESGRAMIDSMKPLEGTVYGFDQIDLALRGCNGLINATSLGMTGQPAMPEELLEGLSSLSPAALVFDMVYAPLHTPLLVRADELGLRCIDGLSMLIGQAAAAFDSFFGQPAPRQHDAELRKLLTS